LFAFSIVQEISFSSHEYDLQYMVCMCSLHPKIITNHFNNYDSLIRETRFKYLYPYRVYVQHYLNNFFHFPLLRNDRVKFKNAHFLFVKPQIFNIILQLQLICGLVLEYGIIENRPRLDINRATNV